MDPAAVSVTLDPSFAFTVLAFVLGGALLGAISDLMPGLHANNFALLLAAAAFGEDCDASADKCTQLDDRFVRAELISRSRYILTASQLFG